MYKIYIKYKNHSKVEVSINIIKLTSLFFRLILENTVPIWTIDIPIIEKRYI